MHVAKGQIVRLMLIGAGTIVNLDEAGGTPAPVYTTTNAIENYDIVGPCELTITGTNVFWTSAGVN